LITISTTPVIAGDSFEMDAVGALRLSPLRRGLAIDSTVDIFTFYVPHRHVYGEIGRASCRERVEISAVAVSGQRKIRGAQAGGDGGLLLLVQDLVTCL